MNNHRICLLYPLFKKGSPTRMHIMIAIGRVIGVGFFVGSGKVISVAGPSMLLVYALSGLFVFLILRLMVSILLSNLKYRSFVDFLADLLGPWAGFVSGWSYWLFWIITGIAEMVVIAGCTQFWFPFLPMWIPTLVTIIVLLGLNLVAVKLFGDAELWFALIKMVTISMVILIGIGLIAIHFESPTGSVASFGNLYCHDGFFPRGLTGFFAGFQMAIFALTGMELIGATSAETANPAKALPQIINRLPRYMMLFYILPLALVISVIPWDELTGQQSAFVDMFVGIKLSIIADIINFAILVSAISAANSCIFSTSRMLYGLTKTNHAPQCFNAISNQGVPHNGLYFSAVCLSGAVALLYFMPRIMQAYTLVTTMASICCMVVWILIPCAYIAYQKARPSLLEASVYKIAGGVITSWLCLAFLSFVFVLLYLEPDTQRGLIATIVLLVIFACFYSRIQRATKQQKTGWM